MAPVTVRKIAPVPQPTLEDLAGIPEATLLDALANARELDQWVCLIDHNGRTVRSNRGLVGKAIEAMDPTVQHPFTEGARFASWINEGAGLDYDPEPEAWEPFALVNASDPITAYGTTPATSPKTTDTEA